MSATYGSRPRSISRLDIRVTTHPLKQFRATIRELQKKRVSALVIDIRGNAGGLDQMVADMMASFYEAVVLRVPELPGARDRPIPDLEDR